MEILAEEVADRLKAVLTGEASMSLLGDRTYDQLAWSVQYVSVLIEQSDLPDWEVTFFIDAGDLDEIFEVVERGGGRRYKVAQARDIFPSDLLQDRATPEFPDPLEALERKIKALPPLGKVDGFN